MTTKLTAKQKLVNTIVALNAGYSEESCKEMKVTELKELLHDIQVEQATPEPELDNATGTLVIHEPTVVLPSPPAKREAKEGGSKLAACFAIFDKAHEAGEDLKEAIAKAFPETSKGVVSSYLCYWRKDRGIATTRAFGNSSTKLNNEQKVLTLMAKLYGDAFNIEIVMALVAAEAAKAEEQEETENEAE